MIEVVELFHPGERTVQTKSLKAQTECDNHAQVEWKETSACCLSHFRFSTRKQLKPWTGSAEEAEAVSFVQAGGAHTEAGC